MTVTPKGDRDTLAEQISEIEREIRDTPYNKATQLHIGRLKAKLARLKEERESKSSQKGLGYAPRKSGDATCVLVGYPSAGKSTLLNALTNAQSPVGTYDFTTLHVIPGSMVHKGAHVQVLDVPGLISGAAAGKGRGREIISVVRAADLILIVVDEFSEYQVSVVKKELHEAGIRINQTRPNVAIAKKPRGGVVISGVHHLAVDEATTKAILRDFKIHNANISVKEDVNVDRLVDALVPTRRYVPALTVVTKLDQSAQPAHFGDIHVSAQNGAHIESLKDLIFEKLRFIRVYLKPPGRAADTENPLILRHNSTIKEVCNLMHGRISSRLRYAQVWGESATHAGQHVGLNHVLTDNDIVTLITSRK
ncbi:MAG TPA: GTP-binding protein [Candidatus Bathyarchaeia archaeon]|nr:GTP-binding protein [Candidatus Bathyarchaeia archaeon]